jgi:hypothetical protein
MRAGEAQGGRAEPGRQVRGQEKCRARRAGEGTGLSQALSYPRDETESGPLLPS